MLDLNSALENAKLWAKEAGSFQLYMLNKVISCESKSTETDLVTEVDMRCEQMIMENIKKHYPEHNIVTEETGVIGGNSDYRWIIDPLDGTVNYFHGLPIFAVSIALYKEDEAVLGVVYVPRLEEEYYAVKGQGAFLNNNKISVSKATELNAALIGTGFPYDKGIDLENNNLTIFNHFLPNIRGIRRSGSAAFDLCQVACGRLDGFWELKLKLWDIAAAEIIISEAGGALYSSQHEKGYNTIAGNNTIVEKIKDRIEEVYNNF